MTALDEVLRAQSQALLRLLGGEARGALQNNDGNYRSVRRDLTVEDLIAHLAGDATVGFCCSYDSATAHIIGFDVDRRFEQRLPVLRDVLEGRGLGSATFCTNGSGVGRGKVLVTFRYAIPLDDLRVIANEIAADVRRDVRFGIVRDEREFDVYPKSGEEGGLLRIGGRNRRPDRLAAVLEIFFTLDGTVLDLCQVIPCDLLTQGVRGKPPRRRLQRWIARLRKAGLDDWPEGGTKGVFRIVIRLAHECRRVYGEVEGATVLRQILAEVAERSPKLSEPSPTTRDRRHPLRWKGVGSVAWRVASKSAATCDITMSGAKPYVMAQPAAGISNVTLAAIRELLHARGLNPAAFALSLREIGVVAGLDYRQVLREIRRLEAAGVIVTHHRGAQGRKGLKAIRALVLSGESPKLVAARGRRHHAVLRQEERIAERARSLSIASESEGYVPPAAAVDGAELLDYAMRTIRPRRSHPNQIGAIA